MSVVKRNPKVIGSLQSISEDTNINGVIYSWTSKGS